jgi:hypothetical protein
MPPVYGLWRRGFRGYPSLYPRLPAWEGQGGASCAQQCAETDTNGGGLTAFDDLRGRYCCVLAVDHRALGEEGPMQPEFPGAVREDGALDT